MSVLFPALIAAAALVGRTQMVRIAPTIVMGAFALTQAGTEGLNIAIGGVYILATVLGFLGYLYLLNIPTYGGDNYLHLVSGSIPLIFGSGLLRAFGGRETATA